MDLISRTMLMGAGGGEEEPKYWIATLGGSGTDASLGIAVEATGNVYLAGYTNSQSAGDFDFLIPKYNTNGVIQWQRRLGGSGSDFAYGVAVDASGNVYMTGTSNSQGAGSGDVFISKYNASGTIQWQRSLGGASNDAGYSIALDSSANIYICGFSTTTNALITKYDTSGVIQWQRLLGNSGNGIVGRAIAVDTSGNVYITGEFLFSSREQIFIAKYNTSGTLQWQRRLGGATDDVGRGIAVDSSGNVYVTGGVTSQGAGGNDLLIAKYDTSGAIQWQRSLGGAGFDVGLGITLDVSGNIYISGYTDSQGVGGNDVLIAKYNTSGTIQWQRSLGGSGSDFVYGIGLDADENIYIAGSTASQGAGGTDILIAKLPGDGSLTGTYGNFTYAATTLTDAATTLTDAAGSLTGSTPTLTDAATTLTDAATTLTSTTIIIPVAYWIATLTPINDAASMGIAVDADGNAYAAGFADTGTNEVILAKYNTSGTIQWQRSLGDSGADFGAGIAVDSSGNAYVVGYTNSSGGEGGNDVLIAKYDTSGTIQWQRSLGGLLADEGYGIAVDSSGNVYITGFTASQGAGGDDVLIAKYDTSGTIQWQRSLGRTSGEIGYGIAVDSSGNVYVAGSTASQGAGGDDVLIAKYNTSGTIQWQRSLGGTGNEVGYGIAVDSNGNVYVTGYTASQGAGGNDVLIAKYSTSGAIQWQRSLGGLNDDIGRCIAVDPSGNVYVGGGTNFALLVAKLPANGGLTGTYGSLVYAATTLTAATRSLTSATRTLTDAATTLVDKSRSLTSATSSLTITTTTIQAGA